ncbi:DUF4255 domain-containing protein [Aquimarina sp. RZ0]|uniref:DUF4255 domain-containing protein n=1 Tax=Aquimarina sp. RZ0 TaxID=2607730 RepID=UPI0011F3216A|nr:DUF4255 domain-containing protein [Aquimarina sp. RZ0]KAA1247747.1 DUF4255 domain-containing protein [Aquimarina sp. RZ0]
MLDKALTFIASYLNQNLKMTFGLNEDVAVLGSLVNLDGSITKNIENKVILSIINLEHEKTVKNMGGYIPNQQGSFGKVDPPVYLNLYLLVSANYNSENYLESLKMLSAVIGLFQSSIIFTPKTHPELDPLIERLTFEIYNIPIQELSHIWSGIGAKYVPSMVYKIRMICFQKGIIKEEVSAVSGLGTNIKK